MTGLRIDGSPGSGPPLEHRTSVRVRYGEVDRMGVVYHPTYLVYFEQGRTEFLRALGGTYRRLEEDGFLLMVVQTGVRHHRPAGYDEALDVTTRLESVTHVRLRFAYEVRREGTLLASGFTVLACTDRTGRTRRLPRELYQRLEAGLPRGVADFAGKHRDLARVPGESPAEDRL